MELSLSRIQSEFHRACGKRCEAGSQEGGPGHKPLPLPVSCCEWSYGPGTWQDQSSLHRPLLHRQRPTLARPCLAGDCQRRRPTGLQLKCLLPGPISQGHSPLHLPRKNAGRPQAVGDAHCHGRHAETLGFPMLSVPTPEDIGYPASERPCRPQGCGWLYKAEATGGGRGCQTPGAIWLLWVVTWGSQPLRASLNHILQTSSPPGTCQAQTPASRPGKEAFGGNIGEA
jgi:hypothetical protein